MSDVRTSTFNINVKWFVFVDSPTIEGELSLQISLLDDFDIPQYNPETNLYLNGTKHYSLQLGGDRAGTLIGYCDSDGMSMDDQHPIAAYVFIIGGAISWLSKRQDIVCLSTTEAEYVALSHAAKEADDRYHARTKHIDICFYFVQEKVEDNKLEITYLLTDQMVVDLLTKAIPGLQLVKLGKALRLTADIN
ncbi:hypothetical protein NM688_g1666 [Phlebia brevispora]|uniref:Uncharacterized protein n=1 Tax=Phlebia brevispora TaxID=194682 RepID=A0ACC1TAK0_9APHY|nr:hypothetical protein NM688_g1666 [Phlebia brevispora]